MHNLEVSGEFPSPFGVYGFSITSVKLVYVMVSDKFPSPFGVYGFSISIKNYMMNKAWFPSPFGVYGFSIFIPDGIAFSDSGVSVPFRGLWFLNKNYACETG